MKRKKLHELMSIQREHTIQVRTKRNYSFDVAQKLLHFKCWSEKNFFHFHFFSSAAQSAHSLENGAHKRTWKIKIKTIEREKGGNENIMEKEQLKRMNEKNVI